MIRARSPWVEKITKRVCHRFIVPKLRVRSNAGHSVSHGNLLGRVVGLDAHDRIYQGICRIIGKVGWFASKLR